MVTTTAKKSPVLTMRNIGMAHAQLKTVTHKYRGRRPMRSVRAAQPTVAPIPMAEATHSARIVSADVAFSVLCR